MFNIRVDIGIERVKYYNKSYDVYALKNVYTYTLTK